MNKKLLLTMAMVAGLACNTVLSVQTVGAYSKNENQKSKNYVVIKKQINCFSDVKNIINDLCNKLQNGNWNDCPIITIPDCNQPESDIPEASTPDSNIPEATEPESNTPEATTPDSGIPEASEPESNVPETDKPESNIPEQDNSNKPETDNDQTENENTTLSYAEQILKLVNEERKKAGLHALALDKKISNAADIRATEIVTSFSHTRPDGRKFSTVLTDNQIRFSGAGENIAWGQKSPEQVMTAWMNSSGHRANILNPRYTKLGVGHYQNTSGTNYWVQLFTY